MEQGLQKANHCKQLAEWTRRVEMCRKSGRKVSDWCAEQGIPVSTYYSWQRKVYQAVTAEPEVCFTEISARPAGRETAAKVQWGELQVDIYVGADGETIRAIIEALKTC